jgi:hypothetical protein
MPYITMIMNRKKQMKIVVADRSDGVVSNTLTMGSYSALCL